MHKTFEIIFYDNGRSCTVKGNFISKVTDLNLQTEIAAFRLHIGRKFENGRLYRLNLQQLLLK